MTDLLETTDIELLRGWRRGDVRKGAELYERHKTSITNLFRRNVRSRAEIPDLVQQTFLACVEAQRDPEVVGSVRGYILGIAFHTMTRFFRKRRFKRNTDTDDGVVVLAVLEPDPEYLLTLSDEQRLLMKSLRRLKIEFQVVLELNYWEGVSCDDIAVTLDIPQGTARSRLQHGRAALAKKMAELADSPELLAATTVSLRAWQREIQTWIAARAAVANKREQR